MTLPKRTRSVLLCAEFTRWACAIILQRRFHPGGTAASSDCRAARATAHRALVAVVFLLAIAASTSNASEIYSRGGLGSVEDYVSNNGDYRSTNQGFSGDYVPLLGVTVWNGEGTLEDGHQFDGVEIIEVFPAGSAAVAGLKGQRRQVQALMIIATVAASVFFPPAMMGARLLESRHIGESREFIIAVDGIRTHDVDDFGAALKLAKPGQIVYLTVVRNGHREQLKVPL